MIVDTNTNTIGFKCVLTSMPVTRIREKQDILESGNFNKILQSLADKYKEQTGTTITSEYQLHIYHIDEILKWEETTESIGPYFTSSITKDVGDPLKYIASLLVTARVKRNIVVIEIDDKRKLNEMKNSLLKLAIDSETFFIE